MYLILAVIAVFIVLVISEIGWRQKWLANEVGRKFVHIIVGSFVAFWPYFLSWNQIRLLSIAFLVVVIVSSKLKLFRAIHSVQRPTYGEICFALVVGLLTFVTQSKGVYAAALLQMSLADGFAAIAGTSYGKRNTYHVFGHTKSIVGTSAFIVTCLAILIAYSVFVGSLPLWLVVTTPFVAAFIENIAPLGLDNLAVPLSVAVILTSF